MIPTIGYFQLQKWIHVYKETINHFMQNVRPTDSLFRKTYEKKCPQCSRKGMINQATLELGPWLNKLVNQQKTLAKREYSFCQFLQYTNCLRNSYMKFIINIVHNLKLHCYRIVLLHVPLTLASHFMSSLHPQFGGPITIAGQIFKWWWKLKIIIARKKNRYLFIWTYAKNQDIISVKEMHY